MKICGWGGLARPSRLRRSHTAGMKSKVHPTGTDAPMCQDTRSGGLGKCLARTEVCHDPLVDFAGQEAFEAPDDLAFGPAVGRASCDVCDGRVVESHADDDGSIEGRVGVSVATPREAVPAGGSPGRGRDRTRAAQLREGGVRVNPVWVIAEEDEHFGRRAGADTEARTEGGATSQSSVARGAGRAS